MGLILITHDLGVVADVADRIEVMYAGRIVEEADVEDIYANPAHPYTEGLLAVIPRVDLKGRRSPRSPASRRTWPASRPGARSTRVPARARDLHDRRPPSCSRSPWAAQERLPLLPRRCSHGAADEVILEVRDS